LTIACLSGSAGLGNPAAAPIVLAQSDAAEIEF
jgi:hypothetical protein